MRVACFTSFTFSYLSRARILASSLRRFHPEWDMVALITDEAPPEMDQKSLADFNRVFYASDLDFFRYRSWIFKHDIVEACTAVKGHMLSILLEQEKYEKVVYFDPDIAVFNSLTRIEGLLDNHSVILTPHQVEANISEMAVQDNEMTSLLYGIFNLGFVAVRRDVDGIAFAKWWAERLYRACYDDIRRGIFTDQKYCDLVPALFGNVYVERDAGCNVASWNLSRRGIRFGAEGEILVQGSLLKFYHFTKIGSAGDSMTERYAGDNLEVFEIWNWYKRQMSQMWVDGIPSRYWVYNSFSNGEAITKNVREFYRSRPDVMSFFDDPFATEGNSFLEWAKREAPTLFANA